MGLGGRSTRGRQGAAGAGGGGCVICATRRRAQEGNDGFESGQGVMASTGPAKRELFRASWSREGNDFFSFPRGPRTESPSTSRLRVCGRGSTRQVNGGERERERARGWGGAGRGSRSNGQMYGAGGRSAGRAGGQGNKAAGTGTGTGWDVGSDDCRSRRREENSGVEVEWTAVAPGGFGGRDR